jgi:hypothetical protein
MAFCSSAAMAEVTPSDAEVATLVGVLESRGCLIADYNDYSILEDSKLDADVANAIIAKLVETGEISFGDEGMVLKTPGCLAGKAEVAPATEETATAAAPDRAAFVALMEAHGCKLSFDEAETVLSGAGFTPQNANGMMEAMAAKGELELGEDAMTLKTGTCQ